MTGWLVPLVALIGAVTAISAVVIDAKTRPASKAVTIPLTGRQARSDALGWFRLASELALSHDEGRSMAGVQMLGTLATAPNTSKQDLAMIESVLSTMLESTVSHMEQLPGTGEQVDTEAEAFSNVIFTNRWSISPAADGLEEEPPVPSGLEASNEIGGDWT